MGNSFRFGYVLVGAAFLFQACRLVLATLDASQLPLSPETEQLLLIVAAVSMAIFLTGGVSYFAHAALTAPRWRIALGITWLLLLGASAGMELHEIAGALAHGLTATGCMLAVVASSHPRPPGSVLCPGCGRAFASKQARGGHQRSCPARALALPASR